MLYNTGRMDIWYFLLIVMMFVSMWASYKVRNNFTKYSQIESDSKLTGVEVAKMILNRNGIHDVDIQPIRGQLTDHYDPRSKTLRLSEGVYDKNSISAVSVAAHEVGHAIQHNEGYAFLRFRSALAPIVSFSSQFVFILIFIGFLMDLAGLQKLGIILYSLSVLFHIITLPVEFNASRRALVNLEQGRIISSQEVSPSKKVLGAAAMTYVASALVSVIQLLRLMSMRRD